MKGFWCDCGSKLAEILSHWGYELEAIKKSQKNRQKNLSEEKKDKIKEYRRQRYHYKKKSIEK